MPGFIGDGYEERAYLRGVPKLYDDVRFTFRPMLAEARADYVDRGSRLRAREQTRRSAEVIEHHVIDWDIRNGDNHLLPITTDVILRLHPNLFNRFLWVITGTEAWDDDPDEPGTPPQRTRATLIEDQKNS